MPDDKNDGLAGSPKDAVTGAVRKPTGRATSPEPEDGKTPAGQRNSAHDGDEQEGADHETEEAAAYRENDA